MKNKMNNKFNIFTIVSFLVAFILLSFGLEHPLRADWSDGEDPTRGDAPSSKAIA
jgi:hypothetical protein